MYGGNKQIAYTWTHWTENKTKVQTKLYSILQRRKIPSKQCVYTEHRWESHTEGEREREIKRNQQQWNTIVLAFAIWKRKKSYMVSNLCLAHVAVICIFHKQFFDSVHFFLARTMRIISNSLMQFGRVWTSEHQENTLRPCVCGFFSSSPLLSSLLRSVFIVISLLLSPF